MADWTEPEMREATLIHGPGDNLSDTYRLHYVAPDATNGKMLDVPGWMVGDPEMAAQRLKAADIIRERIRARTLVELGKG
tara:strand:- start:2231 stop:2470 length:240 start_codon:yes stop_codon:yes gene_type:complete